MFLSFRIEEKTAFLEQTNFTLFGCCLSLSWLRLTGRTRHYYSLPLSAFLFSFGKPPLLSSALLVLFEIVIRVLVVSGSFLILCGTLLLFFTEGAR